MDSLREKMLELIFVLNKICYEKSTQLCRYGFFVKHEPLKFDIKTYPF